MKALIFPEKVRLDFIVLQQKLVLWTRSTEEAGQSVLGPAAILMSFPSRLVCGDAQNPKFHRNPPEHVRDGENRLLLRRHQSCSCDSILII